MKLQKNRDGYYHLLYRDINNRRRQFSTHQKDRAEAEKIVKMSGVMEIARAAKAGILTREIVGVIISGKKRTVLDVLQEWIKAQRYRSYANKTIDNSRASVQSFVDSLGVDGPKRTITSITEEEIDRWVNRDDSRIMASTREFHLGRLKVMFDFARDRGYVLANPANLIAVDYSRLIHSQKEPRPKNAFTDQEVYQILDYFHPDTGKYPSVFWYCATAISRWSGLRLSDVACLEWDNLKIVGKIIVWTRKKDKRVEVSADHEEIRNAIAMIPHTGSPYCFPDERQTYIDGTGMNSSPFGKACSALALFNLSFHSLRRAYIRARYKEGVPVPTIMQEVGHSRQETTEIYLGSDYAGEGGVGGDALASASFK